jgi:hypothetical protein
MLYSLAAGTLYHTTSVVYSKMTRSGELYAMLSGQDGPLFLKICARRMRDKDVYVASGGIMVNSTASSVLLGVIPPGRLLGFRTQKQVKRPVHGALDLWGPRDIRCSCNYPQSLSGRKAHRVFSFLTSLITMYRENVIQPQRNHLIWLSCAVVIAFCAVL